ncbi:CYTH domain-containing protein [Alteromonas sp. ASW11-130]|uniref:CYTH domain-containing protein n=1 Tax=Alteromonas sp. ASW11-130 TaxID=3015775 RepID=UPI0022424CF4|nr:CYTH domain-containing protein [Alteromonas sp. ASW11-130]MCW8091877.1 CYTH domain-containing protein [Alteromonas sp. ASW11-130]
MAEIEIKFATRQPSHQLLEERVVPFVEKAGAKLEKLTPQSLKNDYYDTSEQLFHEHKIGFRVRQNGDQIEQTVKTQGKVDAGLHARGEYNVTLSKPVPDLTLFPRDIWPSGWNIVDINTQLTPQFSTHFERQGYLVHWQNSTIEMVVDNGEAATEKINAAINEIELELKTGKVEDLFALAAMVNQHSEVRLSDVSKAAQGYQLLHGWQLQIKPLPAVLPLHGNVSTEMAFAEAVKCALAHWQRHEHLFIETGSVKMLQEVGTSVRLLLQSVSLYLPVLQCPEMLALHKQLMDYAQQWSWVEDLQSLRYLLSKKSLFARFLTKHPPLVSYLQGRKAGLIHAHEPTQVFYSNESTAIKLCAAQLLELKPWQTHSQGFDVPVMEHAKGWLSQGWQTIQQSMSKERSMQEANYSSIEVLLRQTLWNGFLLADLFPAEHGQFRAPWLDIVMGIDELKALLMLRNALTDAELDSPEEASAWVNNKIASLVQVMERTRKVAVQGDLYWQNLNLGSE